tara:strand:+ start:511 stop:975 length:465 start_codon:yes stop_codon:yes gene_type:complete
MSTDSSRARGRRGGVKRPAAVSGPGRLSRRTDGAAPSIEDVRGMVTESAGEETDLVNQVRQGNVTLPPATVAAPPEEVSTEITTLPAGAAEIFAGGDDLPINTQSTMAQESSSLLEPDDVMLIRAMAKINPSQELISLLQFAEQKINRTPQQFG